MSRPVVAVMLLAAVTALGAPKAKAKAKRTKPAAEAPAKSSGPGEVKYLTATQAFLDRGSDDGVAVGQKLTFSRGGRTTGTCIVDTVAEHWSTCPATGVRRGDRFAVQRAAAPLPAPPKPLASDDELARRRDVLTAAELAQVEFEGGAGLRAGGHNASVTASHTTYSNMASAVGPFQVQRVDAAVYDVEIWKGLRASADLSVLNFSRRPDTFRSAFRGTPDLLVRQLEVAFRRRDVGFSGALGRTWLRYAPGLLVVDGAQASWRAQSEWIETGVYGGFLPNAYTLTVQPSQYTAGAFLMTRFQFGKGADATLVQSEVRAGYAAKDALGTRLEVGAAIHAYAGRTFDGHAAVEIGVGGAQAAGAIDAARFDLGWRASETFRLVGGLRYRGASPSGVVELGAVSPGQRAAHADLALTYEAKPWLWVGLSGGAASDFGAGLTQGRFGPEVTFPGLLGRGGGLSLGYMEELGWMRARHGYLQFVVSAFGRVRLLSRTSWFQQVAVQDSAGLAANELGETVSLEVTFVRWLWLRASVSGRMRAEDVSQAAGLFSVQLGGQL